MNFTFSQEHKRFKRDSSGEEEEEDSCEDELSMPRPGKKTRGRVKVKMEFIKSKNRRYTTFSKRKTGIMKKAHELATLTGTQVMVLVASETGHVYTFATQKLQPLITSEAGKALIQTCLNSPEGGVGGTGVNSRMTETGYEEHDLSYNVNHDESKELDDLDVEEDEYDEDSKLTMCFSKDNSPESDEETSQRNNLPGRSHSSSSEASSQPTMSIPPHILSQLIKSASSASTTVSSSSFVDFGPLLPSATLNTSKPKLETLPRLSISRSHPEVSLIKPSEPDPRILARSRIDAALKESSVLSSISSSSVLSSLSSSSTSLFRPIEPNPSTIPKSLLSLRPVPVSAPRLIVGSEASDQNLINLPTHVKALAPKILLPKHPVKNIKRKQ